MTGFFKVTSFGLNTKTSCIHFFTITRIYIINHIWSKQIAPPLMFKNNINQQSINKNKHTNDFY